MWFANLKYSRTFLIIFLGYAYFSTKVLAQNEIKSLPIQYGQYTKSYPLINPAYAGAYAKAEVNTGVQRQGGSWSNISTYYLNANIRLTKNRILPTSLPADTLEENEEAEEEKEESEPGQEIIPTNFHVAGITLIGDKEGTFLNRTGVYLLYSWHTRISSSMFLSAGTSLGFKNYSVDESYVNGGGSSYAPDGTVGLSLYSDQYSFGLSLGQLFNGKLMPLREVTRLVPHWNITASRTWEVSRFVALKPSVLIRMAPSLPTDVNLYLGALLQNAFSATVGYKYQRGMTCIIGLEKLRIGNNNFKAAFSYYFPTGNTTQLRINTYEITLNYFLKPNPNRYGIIFQ